MSNNSTIRISFTGDVMCEYTRLCEYAKSDGYSFASLFEPCSKIFHESDYVVANLETTIAGSDLQYSYKDYSFNTPEQLLKDMKAAGISMVTTANNHVLDRGILGSENTIKNIIGAGLDYTGSSAFGKRKSPLIKKIGNCKIGFLSYTYGTEACYNNVYLKAKDQYRVNLFQNQELTNPIERFCLRNKSIIAKGIRYIGRKIIPSYFNMNIEDHPQSSEKQRISIIHDLQYCKKNGCDLIITCLHCGGQFNDEPTELTKQTANYFIEEGTDLVVVNHEHLIQRAQLKKEDRKIAFCLGNYSSNYAIDRPPYDKDAQCSILLHIYISKTGIQIKTRYTFTVLLSQRENGIIKTIPLYNAWINCKDDVMRLQFEKMNMNSIQRFVGHKLSIHIKPQLEYEYEKITSL